MIRLSLSEEDFDTLKRDLALLQNFRRLAMVPTVPNAHLIPKVQREFDQTTKLTVTIYEQESMQLDTTQIVSLEEVQREHEKR